MRLGTSSGLIGRQSDTLWKCEPQVFTCQGSDLANWSLGSSSRETGVKPPSPNHRFAIALHSPDGAFETGLRMCPAEKNVRTLGCGVRRDTFSSPV